MKSNPLNFGNTVGFLRAAYHRLYHRPPRGMRIGRNSFVFCPRRVSGASCISVGEESVISPNGFLCAITEAVGVRYQPEIHIGNHVYIGQYVWVIAMSKVTIDSGCVLSERVYISDASHGLDPMAGPIMQQELVCKGEVHIQESTFIGYGACIMPGVTLGKHCVVGANSVVTHSFPDYSMVAGSPAKLVKVYSLERQEWERVPRKSP